MRPLALLILVVVVFILFWLSYGRKRHNISLARARKKLYRQLDHQARDGNKDAMYRLAKLFYQERDPQYYPLIFKWVQILAAVEQDPAVWLMLGDLLASGYGTERDLKRALSSYEQALSFDIAASKYSNLTLEAHNYLEQRVIALREELEKEN